MKDRALLFSQKDDDRCRSIAVHSTHHWLDTIEEMLDYKARYLGHWHINNRIDKLHFLMHDVEMPID